MSRIRHNQYLHCNLRITDFLFCVFHNSSRLRLHFRNNYIKMYSYVFVYLEKKFWKLFFFIIIKMNFLSTKIRLVSVAFQNAPVVSYDPVHGITWFQQTILFIHEDKFEKKKPTNIASISLSFQFVSFRWMRCLHKVCNRSCRSRVNMNHQTWFSIEISTKQTNVRKRIRKNHRK